MMKKLDIINDALVDSKPYLVNWKEVEDLVKRLSKESRDALEFCHKLEAMMCVEEDATLKTDLRILLLNLKAKISKTKVT